MEDISKEEFKKLIGKVKYELGLTQEEIAKRVGVHKTYISGMLNGSVPVTSRLVAKMKEEFPFLLELSFSPETVPPSDETSILRELLQAKEELLQSKEALLKEREVRLKEKDEMIGILREKIAGLESFIGEKSVPVASSTRNATGIPVQGLSTRSGL